MFRLHPRLEQDTIAVSTLTLSELRLMNDARYRWFVLVPARPGLREFHDLPPADRVQLMEEITDVSRAMENLYSPDKINVGMLGNIVSQLHIHVVARRKDDPAWPGPVWGYGTPEPIDAELAGRIGAEMSDALARENAP